MKTFICLVVALMISASAIQGQTPGSVNLDGAIVSAELIGSPVFAADGSQVGQVADISFNEDLEPHRLRITTGSKLGFGARTVELPRGSFTTSRGTVVLLLPIEFVQDLPALSPRMEEK